MTSLDTHDTHLTRHTTRARAGTALYPVPTGRHVLWAAFALVALALGVVLGALPGALLWHSFEAASIGFLLAGPLFGLLALRYGLGHRCGWGLREMGFVRPRHTLWHLLWWTPATLVVGGTGAMLIGSSLGLESGGDEVTSTVDTALGIHWSLGVLSVLLAAVVAPLIEEVVFRRALLDWLMTKLPVTIAVILTIVVFTVIHLAPVAMLYILFLSTSLTLSRLWFRSLWAPLIIHVTNNGLLSAVAVAAVI